MNSGNDQQAQDGFRPLASDQGESLLNAQDVRPALIQYVNAEARFILSSGISYIYGDQQPVPNAGEYNAPEWLAKFNEHTTPQVEWAEGLLEVALQQEFSRRIEAVLAQVERDLAPARDELKQKALRTVTNAIIKGLHDQDQMSQKKLRAALQAAGVLREA